MSHTEYWTNLIYIMLLNDIITADVQFIQHINDINRLIYRAEGREAHNIWEVDGHIIEQLWGHSTSCDEFESNWPGRESMWILQHDVAT